ncbi:MAG: hypothetical protein ACK5QX_01430 [bacterium]
MYNPVTGKFSVSKITRAAMAELQITLNFIDDRPKSLDYMLNLSALHEILPKVARKYIVPGKTGSLSLTRTQAIALALHATYFNTTSTAFQIGMLIKQQLLNHHYDFFRKG